MQTNIYCLFVLYCRSYKTLASHLILTVTTALKTLSWACHTSRQLKLTDYPTDANSDLKPPCKVAEVKSVLGLGNEYRWLVSSLACIAAALNKNLKKGEPKTCNPPHKKIRTTLATLQDRVVSAPVLDLPRSRGHWNLDNDACNSQIRCFLRQKRTGWNEEASQLLVNYAERSRTELLYNTSRVFGIGLSCFAITPLFGMSYIYS